MTPALRRLLERAYPPAPELAGVEVHGTTRATFVMRGALAAGAAYGLGAVGPLVRDALAAPEFSSPRQTGQSDIEILNFLLTFERLQADFYRRGGRVDVGGEGRGLIGEIADNEREHARFLAGAIRSLGGRANRPPLVTFPIGGRRDFLQLAQTLEDTGVLAYNGASPLIESKAVLNRASQIAQVEGRHAGAIRMLRGQTVTDGALDGTLEFQEVVERVEPYIIDSPPSFEQAPPQSGI
jgi:rubrerythrin